LAIEREAAGFIREDKLIWHGYQTQKSQIKQAACDLETGDNKNRFNGLESIA
jgi:hypothetical protein